MKTYTAGANAERKAIIAKVRRELRNAIVQQPALVDHPFAALLNWLLDRHARYNKRKGGVGR